MACIVTDIVGLLQISTNLVQRLSIFDFSLASLLARTPYDLDPKHIFINKWIFVYFTMVFCLQNNGNII